MTRRRGRVLDSVSENDDDSDPEKDAGEGQEDVHQPHERGVDEAAVVSGDEPDDRTHEKREPDARERDSERNPRAEQEAA
jgi:hypothetical protein